MAVGFFLLATGPLPAGAKEILQRQAWQDPATLEAAARRPALKATLARFVAEPQVWVRLAHGGGARGSAWAHEIRAWLIALGIPSGRIQIDPGMAPSGELHLAVPRAGERP